MIRYQSGATVIKLLSYEKPPAKTAGPIRDAIGHPADYRVHNRS
jgi:hypothetical protein